MGPPRLPVVARRGPGTYRERIGPGDHVLAVALGHRADPFRLRAVSQIEAPSPGRSFAFLPAGEHRVMEVERSGPSVLIHVPDQPVAQQSEMATLRAQHPLVTHAFDEHLVAMAEILADPSTLDAEHVSATSRMILLRLAQGLGPDPFRPTGPVEAAVAHIEANLATQLSLSEVAEVAGRSQYHFARRFREIMGQSVHRFVMGRRCARAEQLLRETDEAIAQIAYAVGFGSQSHMTTVIRRTLGRTPGEVRRAGAAARRDGVGALP